MAVNWDYFDKFEVVNDKYLPYKGEGATKAMQVTTAVNKLVYKYYNDGDVFDNTHHLKGWANDLSSYANWLYYYTTDKAQEILNKIHKVKTESEYEDLLKELADELLNEEFLAELNIIKKEKTIYECDGKFKYEEPTEEEDYY